jgi:hypothetical protein
MLDKFSLVLDNAEDVFFLDNQILIVVNVYLGTRVFVEEYYISDFNLFYL